MYSPSLVNPEAISLMSSVSTVHGPAVLVTKKALFTTAPNRLPSDLLQEHPVTRLIQVLHLLRLVQQAGLPLLCPVNVDALVELLLISDSSRSMFDWPMPLCHDDTVCRHTP